MRHRRRVAPFVPSMTAALLTVLALILAACGSQPATPPRQEQTPVSIQLAWTHEYSSAAFYAAEKNGHYAAEGLALRIEAGGFGPNGYIEPITQVLDGSVDFGIVTASSLIKARSDGQALVGIASIFQRSPDSILARPESGIRRPQDLAGKRVMAADGGAREMLESLLDSQGVDRSSVEIVSRTSYGVEPLLNNEIDALVGWVINEGVLMREAGIEPNVILLSDYGIDTYPLVVFATEKMISERPEVVQRFVRATIAGMRDVVANPDAAAGLALEYDKTLDLDGQRRRLQAALPLINPAGATLGGMQPEIWEITERLMLEKKAISAAIDLDQAYTLKFIETTASR